jgi:mono/diheme cytochrome c family protein
MARPRILPLLFLLALFLPAPAMLPAQALRLTRENSGLVDNFVTRITLFNGLPIACTDSGISIVQENAIDTWRRGSPGFPDSAIRSGAVFQGRLWVGTDGKGLARYDNTEWKMFSTQNSGLIDNFVTTLAVWGPKLYIGTREGICAFNGFLWERLFLPENRPVFVSALAMDGDRLWVGTREGVFQIQDGKTATRVDLDVSPPRVVAIDISGGVTFIAFENALALIAPGQDPVIMRGEALPSGRLYDLLATDNGVICASGDGVVFVDRQGGMEEFILDTPNQFPSLPVTALGRGNGYLWLALEGGGLVRLPENLKRRPRVSTSVQAALSSSATTAAATVAQSATTEAIRITRVLNFLPDQTETGQPAKTAPGRPGSPSSSSSQPAVSTFLSSIGGTPTEASPVSRPVTNSSSRFGQGSRLPSTPPPLSSGVTRPSPVERKTAPSSSSPPSTFLNSVAAAPVPVRGIPNSWVPVGGANRSGTVSPPTTPANPRSKAALQPISTFLGSVSPGNSSATGPSSAWVVAGKPSSAAPVAVPSSAPAPSSSSRSFSGSPSSPQAPSTFLGSIGNPTVISGSVAPAPTRPRDATRLSFARMIQPMITQKCLNCHTRGSGSYFPLNDGPKLISYFRANGTVRFEAAAGPGRGMAGLITPGEMKLMKDWVAQGAPE